jgi:hypothetical protein
MFERPSKQKGSEEIGNDRIFSKGNGTSRENSKGSFTSTTPFGERNSIRIVESTVHQIYLLSIQE